MSETTACFTDGKIRSGGKLELTSFFVAPVLSELSSPEASLLFLADFHTYCTEMFESASQCKEVLLEHSLISIVLWTENISDHIS